MAATASAAATKMALSSSSSSSILTPKYSPLQQQQHYPSLLSGLAPTAPMLKAPRFKILAQLGGGSDGEMNKEDKKKFITREQEPEQYWQTAGEREGENPMMTPLPYIIIFGMSTPFVILAIAFANGWIKVPIR